MILSDQDIKKWVKEKKLIITPFDEELIQPSSYNLRLSSTFRVFRNTQMPYLDIQNPVSGFMEVIQIKKDQPIIIHPREFILGDTMEYFEFPNNLVGRLDGKSSIGRIGIVIHSTAGFFDPGFKGTGTLEISNMANIPIALYPGMKIAQMSFVMMSSPAVVPYGSKALGSKYQGQRGPTESRLFKEFAVKKFKKNKT